MSTFRTPLETNPWFHHFIARKTYTKRAMIAIALNCKAKPEDVGVTISVMLTGKSLFVSTSDTKCPNGHVRNWHPFAKAYMCLPCMYNYNLARLNEIDLEAQSEHNADHHLKEKESVDNPDQRGHQSDEDQSYVVNH